DFQTMMDHVPLASIERSSSPRQLKFAHVLCSTYHAPRITHHASRRQPMTQFTDCEIIIIGGGAVGCGVAYALAKAGKTDLLLLERAGDVGQATTSQGGGRCGQGRASD